MLVRGTAGRSSSSNNNALRPAPPVEAMPATPRFKVSQTDLDVLVVIKVPHVRVGGAETHVDGTEFSFYCKPYLLR